LALPTRLKLSVGGTCSLAVEIKLLLSATNKGVQSGTELRHRRWIVDVIVLMYIKIEKIIEKNQVTTPAAYQRRFCIRTPKVLFV